MGLDYLMKKTWHTGSMKNIEKVWLAQQKQRELQRKYQEQKKKLKEERHNQQMKKVQAEAGLIPKSHTQRLDWLYDGGSKVQQAKSTEEYLFKPITNSQVNKKQVKQIFKQKITNQKCEQFTLLHDDPLYSIMEQENRQQRQIIQNPVQMKNLYEQLDRMLEQKQRRKKQKKEKKKKKQSRSRSRDKDRSRRQQSDSESESKKSKKSKTSKHSSHSSKSNSLYNNYLRERLGNILVEDQDGNMHPDFNLHKNRARQKYYQQKAALSKQKREKSLQTMITDAKDLKEKRQKMCDQKQQQQLLMQRANKSNFLDELKDEKRNKQLGESLCENLQKHKKRLMKIGEQTDTFHKADK